MAPMPAAANARWLAWVARPVSWRRIVSSWCPNVLPRMSGMPMNAINIASDDIVWPMVLAYFITWKTWSGVTSRPPMMRARR
jgi:hypothetical protein